MTYLHHGTHWHKSHQEPATRGWPCTFIPNMFPFPLFICVIMAVGKGVATPVKTGLPPSRSGDLEVAHARESPVKKKIEFLRGGWSFRRAGLAKQRLGWWMNGSLEGVRGSCLRTCFVIRDGIPVHPSQFSLPRRHLTLYDSWTLECFLLSSQHQDCARLTPARFFFYILQGLNKICSLLFSLDCKILRLTKECLSIVYDQLLYILPPVFIKLWEKWLFLTFGTVGLHAISIQVRSRFILERRNKLMIAL